MSGNRLGGRQGTAYTGTNAAQPPNWNFNDIDPTQYDTQDYALGDLWMNTITQMIWVLVSLDGNVSSKGPLAVWMPLNGGSGSQTNLAGNDTVTVFPDGMSVINVVGDGVTVSTSNSAPNTLLISTGGSIATSYLTDDANSAVPAAGVLTVAGAGGITTSSAGSTVTITAGAMIPESFPTDNGIANPAANVLQIITDQLGLNSGSSVGFTGVGNVVTLNVTDANSNTIIGLGAGAAGITSVRNTVLGSLAGGSITSGTGRNVMLGYGSGSSITTGNNNILLGYLSGTSLANTESNNILIGSTGVVADSAAIRIGTQAQHTSAYIAGVDGVNVGSTAKVITLGTAGTANKLGTATITAGSGITVTPGANTITLASAGTVSQSFPTNSGTATPAAGVLNILGTGTISTSGAGSTVTIASNTATVYFGAHVSSVSVANVTGNGTQYTVIFDTVDYQLGSSYNNATGTFTAPSTGLYNFTSSVTIGNITVAMTTGTTQFAIAGTGPCVGSASALRVNAGVVQTASNQYRFSNAATLYLNSGDTVTVQVKLENGAGDTASVDGAAGTGLGRCFFTGYRVA